jgi:hypothetical protein
MYIYPSEALTHCQMCVSGKLGSGSKTRSGKTGFNEILKEATTEYDIFVSHLNILLQI